MRIPFRRWLSAPIFPDEEQTRIAELLHLILLALIFLTVLDAALLLIFAPETIPTFWINGAFILIACMLLLIMRRGGVRLAGMILCLTLWLLLLYYIAISGGLGSPTLGFLSLLLAIGVTLFGARGAIGLGLLNIVCLGGFYLAGTRGLLVSMEAPPTLSRLFATNGVLFLLLAALITISGRRAGIALVRARNGERTLAERNRELQGEILERQQAERTLRERESSLAAFINTVDDAMFSVDQNRTLIDFNTAFAQRAKSRLGLELYKGMALLDSFPPLYMSEYSPLFDRVLAGESFTAPLRIRMPERGLNTYNEVTCKPLYSEARDIVGAAIFVREVTERHRAQEELQRRDIVLEAVSIANKTLLKVPDWQAECSNILGILGQATGADRVDIFLIDVDKQGVFSASIRFEWAAPSLPRFIDHPLAQNIKGVEEIYERLVSKRLTVINAQNRPASFRAFANLSKSRTALYLPIMVHDALWGIFILATVYEERTWSKPEYDALQIAADMLGTVIERRQAEGALQQSAARLNILHQIDQAILSSASAEGLAQATLQQIQELLSCQYAAIEIIDPETSEHLLLTATVNNGATELSGNRHPPDQCWLAALNQGRPYMIPDVHSVPDPLLSLQHLPNKGIGGLAVIPLIAHGVLLGSLYLMANETDAFSETYLEIGREVADPLAIAIEQAKLYELAQGHAVELKQRVKERTEQLEAANRAKSAFLANMNHELRTPLNAVLGFTNLLIHQGNLTEKQRDNLNIIARSGQHLLDMINDVLDMSRIEAGRVTVDESSFDLYRTIREVEQIIALRANAKELHVQIDIAPDVPQFIVSDQRKLRQILINLLGNAVKFTDVGSIVLRLQYIQASKTLAESGSLSVEVEDTGWGIAEEEIGTIFEPFTQTESGRTLQQGTGLGLAITKQFVQILGGNITVKSHIGLGTTFTFTIPVKSDITTTTTNSGSQGRVVRLAPGQRSIRILVVDDSEENRYFLHVLLQLAGFEVREAANGNDAVEVYEAWHPHLIFMDMKMPVMDGYEATRRIKASTQGQAVAVIALTADTLEETYAAVLSAGCDDYLPKPLVMSELFTKIAQHLGVQFLYELDETGDSLSSSRQAEEISPTRADLLVLGTAWISDLHTLAVMADSKRMLKKIEEIEDEQPQLANALTQLVKTFQLKTILALTSVPMDGGSSDATRDSKS